MRPKRFLNEGESYSQFLERGAMMAEKERPERELAQFNGVAKLYRMRLDAERGNVPDDPKFRKEYPELFSLLVNNHIDPEHWTEPGKLTITNNNGDWAVGVALAGIGAYVEVLAATVEEGLHKLDVGLADGSLKPRFNLKRRGRPRKTDKSEK